MAVQWKERMIFHQFGWYRRNIQVLSHSRLLCDKAFFIRQNRVPRSRKQLRRDETRQKETKNSMRKGAIGMKKFMAMTMAMVMAAMALTGCGSSNAADDKALPVPGLFQVWR